MVKGRRVRRHDEHPDRRSEQDSAGRWLIPRRAHSDQEYAQVRCMVGPLSCDAFCFDGQTRRCGFYDFHEVAVGDFVIVDLFEYEDSDEEFNICHKYKPSDAYRLRKYVKFPKGVSLEAAGVFGDDNQRSGASPLVEAP